MPVRNPGRTLAPLETLNKLSPVGTCCTLLVRSPRSRRTVWNRPIAKLSSYALL
jgi:hypothetical protein